MLTHYLLFYTVTDDYVERRAAFREQHLDLARSYARDGRLVLGGALRDPVDQAVLLFLVDDPAIIEEFVRNDPYVIHGLVSNWTIRPWTTVVGEHASHAV